MQIIKSYNYYDSQTGNIRFALQNPVLCGNYSSRGLWFKSGIHYAVKSVTTATLIGGVMFSSASYSAEEIRHYEIHAQSLNNALIQFAADSNLELIFNADFLRGLKVKDLSGDMTVRQALEKLLQGSGYTFHFIDARLVTIVPQTIPEKSESDSQSSIPPNNSANYKVLQPMIVEGKDNKLREDYYRYPKSYRVSQTRSSTNTETPIKQVPQSVQVLPRTLIDDQQNLTVSESLRNVSGVITNNPLLTPSFDFTRIRGFRAEQLLDGFTQYYNPGDRESLLNIERIEVLKGPNALLYSGGSGSPAGGLVNLVSKLPSAEPFGEIGGKFGSYGFYQPFFDFNQPVSDQLLFRITGEYTHSDSNIDVIKTERYNINPAITVTNNDNTKLILQGKLSKWEQATYQGLPATGTVSGNFKIPVSTFIGPEDIDSSSAEFYGVWGTLEHAFNDIWTVSLKARYTKSEFDQKTQSLFGSDAIQADQPFFLPSTWLLANAELFQEQVEHSYVINATAQFNIGPTRNTVLLGADYSKIDDQGFFEFDTLPVGTVDLSSPKFSNPYRLPGAGVNNLFVTNTTYGAYMQLQNSIDNRLHLLAGVRLGHVSIDYQNAVPGFNFTTQSHTTKLLPRLGGVMDISDEFSLFFNYSKGMRGQPFANFRGAPEPELSRHFESGLKFNIADQLTGQFAFYRIERSNVTVTNNTVVPRGSDSTAEQRSQGFETDLIWQASDSLSILANYAFTRTEFSNDQGGIVKGTSLPGVPKHSGRFWANYRFQERPFKGLSMGAGIYAKSGTYLSNAHIFKTHSYYTIDAAIHYQIDRFNVGLSLKNLTDEYYFETLDYFGSRVAPGQGRSVFANISMRY